MGATCACVSKQQEETQKAQTTSERPSHPAKLKRTITVQPRLSFQYANALNGLSAKRKSDRIEEERESDIVQGINDVEIKPTRAETAIDAEKAAVPTTIGAIAKHKQMLARRSKSKASSHSIASTRSA